MKSSKVKTVVSVDGDNIHTEQATTSSDIVSIGQPVSLCDPNCHNIQSQST